MGTQITNEQMVLHGAEGSIVETPTVDLNHRKHDAPLLSVHRWQGLEAVQTRSWTIVSLLGDCEVEGNCCCSGMFRLIPSALGQL